jgi:hypothetical protein
VASFNAVSEHFLALGLFVHLLEITHYAAHLRKEGFDSIERWRPTVAQLASLL